MQKRAGGKDKSVTFATSKRFQCGINPLTFIVGFFYTQPESIKNKAWSVWETTGLALEPLTTQHAYFCLTSKTQCIMTNELQVLKQTELLGQQFTVYGSPQEPLFLAKDVAEWINYSDSNVSKMLEMVDEDEKQKIFCSLPNLTKVTKPTESITYVGANRWFLTEEGLYEVLMQSNMPIAKAFKKGVKKILKEIRTNGGYIATTTEDTPELIMARALQVAQRTIENHKLQLQMAQSQIDEQKHQIESLSPLADYTRDVLQSDSTYTLTQIAKDLGYTSVHKFIDVLSANKILYKQSGQWMPTSTFAGRGYFSTRTAKFFHSDGSVGTSISTVITEKGRAFLHTRFGEEVNNE